MLNSKQVLLHGPPILIRPDTDWLVNSTEWQEGRLTRLYISYAIQDGSFKPSNKRARDRETEPDRLVTLNSQPPHARLSQAFVSPESSLPVTVTCSHLGMHVLHRFGCICRNKESKRRAHRHTDPCCFASSSLRKVWEGWLWWILQAREDHRLFWLEPSTLFALCASKDLLTG
jgi:hypothetical protein